MLDLRRLRLLCELDRRGTIAAVAAALHYAPSGVSQQLAQLETEAGVPLLERVGRNVRLTDAAKALAAHAEAVLGRLEAAEAELATFAGEARGVVRIAAFQTAAVALVPAALAALARYEGLRVEVVQAEPEAALPALSARDHDLVLGEEYPGFPAPVVPELDREPLCTDPMRLARAARTGTLPDAAGDVWVMEPPGTVAHAWALAQCRAAGFEPDVRHLASDMSVHLELVRQGLASAFLPEMAWHGRPAPPGSRRLAGQARAITTTVRRGGAAHPAIRLVRDALRAAAREIDQPE
ncbi:MAG: LysR family transcriptional regulator [Streptosporangiales bacterium]|nr:LysR family transcriptional regulator [Streptosporangiales bacterium]